MICNGRAAWWSLSSYSPPSLPVSGVRVVVSTGVVSMTALTVTVALVEEVPLVPVQVMEYVVVTEGKTDTEPEVVFPVENPVPVQEVA